MTLWNVYTALCLIWSFVAFVQTDECLTTSCPNGWLTYESSCYLFDDQVLANWTEARDYCVSHEADLVVIESPGEDQMIIDQAKKFFKPCGTTRSNHPYLWIGATDRDVEGKWVWYTNGRELSKGYTNWSPMNHEPDNVNNQDCALLYGNYNFQWGSGYCGDKHGHLICERNSTVGGMSGIIG